MRERRWLGSLIVGLGVSAPLAGHGADFVGHPKLLFAPEAIPALRAQLRKLAYDNRHCWITNPLLLRRLKPPAAQRLGEVRAPTLIIDADLDVSDIHNIADKLAREIPTAHKVVVRGAGHIVNVEKPDDFNRLTLEFLRKIE